VRGRSDHCPAMKGIETLLERHKTKSRYNEKRPLPLNEGD